VLTSSERRRFYSSHVLAARHIKVNQCPDKSVIVMASVFRW